MKKGVIFLSLRESRRVQVVEHLVKGSMSIAEGMRLLKLSRRQVQRLKRGVAARGITALCHGNRGRTSPRAVAEADRHYILEQAQGPFKDAGYALTAELLAADVQKPINVSSKTVGRILKAAGLPARHRRRGRKARRSRDRMQQPGMLVQMDASPHAWLEDRGPRASLHGAIDDATGNIVGLYFLPTEETRGYFEVVKQMVTQHGVPLAAYCDGGSCFFLRADKLTIEQQLAGDVPVTQFGRALGELNVELIRSLSPQARGRVERLWQTLQERLVIALRLAGICTLDEANQFIPKFMGQFNAQFAVTPVDPKSAFRRGPGVNRLNLILAWKEARSISNGSTLSYNSKTYRLTDRHGVVALGRGTKMTVVELLSGQLKGVLAARWFDLEVFELPPKVAEPEPILKHQPSHPQPMSHPWKAKSFQARLAREAAAALITK